MRRFLFLLCVLAAYIPAHLQRIQHSPPVGVYIAIMGLAAVLVTFRTEPEWGEKALWIALITILMIAEIRNLYVADAEQTNKFASISNSFSSISNSLALTNQGLAETAKGIKITSDAINENTTNSHQQFSQTLRNMNSLATNTEGVVTGGDSYIVITPIPTSLDPGNSHFNLGAIVCPMCKVQNSIPNAYIYMVSPSDGKRIDLLNRVTVDPNSVQPLMSGIDPVAVGDNSYEFMTLARNGNTKEWLTVRFNASDKQWEYKYRVARQVKRPHYDFTTKKAEGEKFKLLVDQNWERNTLAQRGSSTVTK